MFLNFLWVILKKQKETKLIVTTYFTNARCLKHSIINTKLTRKKAKKTKKVNKVLYIKMFHNPYLNSHLTSS